MRAQYILDQLRTKPFTPLRIYLTDGSNNDVRHPDTVIVTARRLVIAIGRETVHWPKMLHGATPYM